MFIVFEGIDGSGKSTQIDLLSRKLAELNKQVHITSEPTNNEIGSLLRKAMKGSVKMNQKSIAALFLADRIDHIQNPDYGMKSRLLKGEIVISSRYYFSSFAFQSEYVSKEWMEESIKQCSNLLKADITFYLNISPELSFERIKSRNEGIEIYENLLKLGRTHHAYLEAFEKYKEEENIFIVNAEKSIEEMHKEIWEIVNSRMT